MIRQLTLVLALATSVLLAPCGAGTYRFESISFPQSPNTHAYAINDAGIVVGAYMDGGFNYHAYSWTVDGAFVNRDPDAPGFPKNNYLHGINATGDVAGAVGRDSPPNLAIIGNVSGNLQAVEFPFNSYYSAYDITDDGRHLGTTDVGAGHRSFLWRVGHEPDYIDIPEFTSVRAFGINNSKVIVGVSEEPNRLRGFEYDSSTGMVQNVAYPGATSTFPFEINDSGVIVGFGRFNETNSDVGFVRDSNGSFETIEFPGATTTIVFGVNNRGDIVGSYLAPGHFANRGFVGWYVPEPASCCLLIVGVAAAFVVIRCRPS